MFRILVLVFYFFLFSLPVKSQILPLEGSSLNYRIIGFSFPSPQKVSNYKLEIAAGHYNTEDSFRKNIIKTLSGINNKIIAEVPSFGSQYTWRAVYTGNHGQITNSALYHFATGMIPNVDTSLFRLRVLKSAEKYKDALVFLDDNKVLYDMNGNPVWFLPPIDGVVMTPRDIKLSPQGTITFLFNPPYEINYDGDVLWKGPQKGIISKDYSENCHHEFTRLANGHYMVLGNEYLLWKQNASFTTDDKTGTAFNDSSYKRTPFGTVIEYDETGNIVWSWRASKYLMASDINYKPSQSNEVIDAHENAFFFDEKNKMIYISFKNISRIIKVKYPEGTVMNNYGEIYKPGVPEMGNGFFCQQHACNISQKGYLYLFNNNSCEAGALPKIIMLQEPHSEKDSLKKVWEYECTIDGTTKQEWKNYRFISGGNVLELPDQSIFACMNGTYSKIFIVSQEKKILWSALAERWNEIEKRWDMSGQYRAYIIPDRKKIEQLIWNTANKDLKTRMDVSRDEPHFSKTINKP